MEIIPAVDLLGGQCVRLVQGQYERATVFSADPVATAVGWQEQGAARLHVVDLDGAKEGAPRNWETVQRIVETVTIPVQLGGGIRSRETVEGALALGVQRVIVGTTAVTDPESARSLFEEFGEQVAVALDVREGEVAIRGWTSGSGRYVVQVALEMKALGATRIIFTDISRDGTLSGVNLAACRQVLELIEVPLIVSGGISTLEDIIQIKEQLSAWGHLEGVIVGKALYTGSILLPEALKAAEEAADAG